MRAKKMGPEKVRWHATLNRNAFNCLSGTGLIREAFLRRDLAVALFTRYAATYRGVSSQSGRNRPCRTLSLVQPTNDQLSERAAGIANKNDVACYWTGIIYT